MARQHVDHGGATAGHGRAGCSGLGGQLPWDDFSPLCRDGSRFAAARTV